MQHHKLFQAVLIIVLILSGSVPACAQAPAAASQPSTDFIVQYSGDFAPVEQTITRLGGQVTYRLDMIHAIAARLPAAAAGELAASRGVVRLSADAPVEKSGKKNPVTPAPRTENVYLQTIQAADLRASRPELTGEGITLAVVDSGIDDLPDLSGHLLASVVVNPDYVDGDVYGHGTHVAGIIAGNGDSSGGRFQGVAPGVNLISVKVSDGTGSGRVSDVVAGLQWVYDHREEYNIRIVNLSINSTKIENYRISVLDAAVEVLWFNGVVVIASSGNNGKPRGIIYPPANDPFIITVGALDDRGTARTNDDIVADYTAMSRIAPNISKPELYAPGSQIISLMAPDSDMAINHSDHIVDGAYLRLSGTSMAAAVASGAAALLLQAEPALNPDQVKYRLTATGRAINERNPGRSIDILNAVNTPTLDSANTGIRISKWLKTGKDDVIWDSVAWNSVAWNSVAWNSVAWNSVAWNSVAWNSVAWEDGQ